MAIDILNIEPTVISRDLKGKYVLIYGNPKTGKTTFSTTFEKNLLLATEKGYNAISGVRAVDIEKYADFKAVLKQLKKPEAKAMYNTITIDTISLLWELCEKFVCASEGVQKLGDIPWGQGWTKVKETFSNDLRELTMLGYGLVLITHSEKRVETVGNNELEFFAPSLNKRCYEIVNRLVDLIGYIGIEWNEDGTSSRYLYTRQTPRVVAGSRWKYLDTKIPFGYTELVNAISDAIDKQEKLDGAKVVDKAIKKEREVLDYKAVRQEAQELWTKLVGADESNANVILKKIEMIFGKPIRLSEITEDQVELLNLAVMDMKEMISELGI